jgi:hypothetical protein
MIPKKKKNLMVIYYKSSGNFKSYINFWMIQINKTFFFFFFEKTN